MRTVENSVNAGECHHSIELPIIVFTGAKEGFRKYRMSSSVCSSGVGPCREGVEYRKARKRAAAARVAIVESEGGVAVSYIRLRWFRR